MQVPIDLVPIVGIIMGTLTVLVPVSLIALRFAIKPIAEAIAMSSRPSDAITGLSWQEKQTCACESRSIACCSEVCGSWHVRH